MIPNVIRESFYSQICEQANISKIILEYPVELAYCSNPCLNGCIYCNEALDIHKGLKRFFGYDSYRTFAGEPLQERAAKAGNPTPITFI